MNPQQQQQMMMAQQMAAQQRQGAQTAQGAYLSIEQQQSMAMLARSGAVSPEKMQQLAMAHQMAAQAKGGMTPQQHQMMAHQQQLQMYSQMSAQYQVNQAAGGAYLTAEQQQSLGVQDANLSPEHQQALANAYHAAAQMTPEMRQQIEQTQRRAMATLAAMQQQPGYASMTPAEQQMALARQMAGLDSAVPGGPPAPAPANPYGAGPPGYAPPAPPVPVAMAAPAGDGTMLSVSFPDGCMIGWDRLRNELFLNGKVTNTKMKQLPARPSPEFSALTGAIQSDEPAVPVAKSGMMTKLGWKKSVIGSESWQTRFFRLSDTTLSYAKDSSSPPLNVITLNNGVTACVVTANTPAQKNRYEYNESISIFTPISEVRAFTSGVVGRDYCVELIVPPQPGTALNVLMGTNTVGLAFGGASGEIRKANRGRTYYLSCLSRVEADEWCNAITNNVRALPVAKMGEVGGANGYAGLNVGVNSARAMHATMNDMFEPAKSLQWYMNTLGTKLPADQVYALLSKFYDDLDRLNIPHP